MVVDKPTGELPAMPSPSSTAPGNVQDSTPGMAHRQVYQFTRGLPQGEKHVKHLVRMPGDPEAETETRDILRRRGVLDPEVSGFSNVKFLKKVTYNNTQTPAIRRQVGGLEKAPDEAQNPLHEWRYEDRRKPQEILPFLWLGPAAAAKDTNFLKANAITMVLAVKDDTSLGGALLTTNTAVQLGLQGEQVKVPRDKLVSRFPEAIDKINIHLSDCFDRREAENNERALNREPLLKSLPGKVLVFDLNGNDAAAAVVGAYIMAMFSTEAWEATFIMQAKRFCVNAQFVQDYLIRYHAIVKGKRDVNEGYSLRDNPTQRPAQAETADKSSRKRRFSVDNMLADLDNFGLSEHDPSKSAEAEPTLSLNSDRGEARQISAPFSDPEGFASDD